MAFKKNTHISSSKVAFLIGVMLSCNAQALRYEINTGNTWSKLSPLSNLESGPSHYAPLDPNSAFGQSDAAFLWLHAYKEGAEPLWSTLTNTPVNDAVITTEVGPYKEAYINVSDNPEVSNGPLIGQWNWRTCCTQSIATKGDEGSWKLDVTLDLYSGINHWFYLSANTVSATQVTLTDNTTQAPTVISTPSPLFLFGIGAWLGFIQRRKSTLFIGR